ncbi:MAG: SEL1-like repeat protein [Gammaproteobacteria bacterium]
MDDSEFHALQELAIDGDADVMVDIAMELRARGDNMQAMEWLIRAGNTGNPKAVAELAHAYGTGTGAEKNDKLALHWIQRAAALGNPEGMALLAKSYHERAEDLAADFKQMVASLLKAVGAGSSEAMRLLGEAYANGEGVPASIEKAFTWYKRAAEAGNITAMRKLAESHFKGEEVKKDLKAFFGWTRQGAEAGDASMMFNLANAYKDGLGTEADKPAFFHWIKRAADQNYPPALFGLAMAYRDGIGIRPDQQEYTRLLERAATAGEPGAMNNLAINYLYGLGVQVNAQKHFQLLTQAAKAGDLSAMFNLSHAYRDGAGTAKNQDEYVAWLEKAAQLQHPTAMVEMSAYYLKATLADRRHMDVEQLAKDLLFEQFATRAAELGDGRAMYLLAKAHRMGIGASHDPAAARQWIERAAEAHFPMAMIELAQSYHDGAGYDKDETKYFEWIKRAAESGDVPAKRMLALAYHDAQGTNRSISECRRWLEEAANEGDQAAFVLLGLLELEQDNQIGANTLRDMLVPFMGLQAEISKIKKNLIVREAPEGVSHFTTLEAVTAMLSGGAADAAMSNRLRLYNAAYLDDAQDGRRLFEGEASSTAGLLREFFPDNTSRDWPLTTPWDGREYSVYIASFNLRSDYLDLWRAYGRDGSGFCVVTPLAAFSQQGDKLPFNQMHETELAEPASMSEELQSDPAAAQTKIPERPRHKRFVQPVLYRVEYDPAAVAEALDGLQPHLEAIAGIKKALGKDAGIIDALVRILVSDVLYLFKHEAYQGEREARIVAAFDISSDYINSDQSRLPARLYVETEPCLFVEDNSRIIVGPKVKDRAAAYLDLRYHLAKSRWALSTQVSYSSVQYR